MPEFGKTYNVGGSLDRREWDAMVKRIGGGDNHAMRMALDPAVRKAAIEVRDKVKADTPVLTGNLKDSIEQHILAPSDHEVATAVWYAPIVESRPPGKFKKPGAMFARNLGFAEERLRIHIENLLARLTA